MKAIFINLSHPETKHISGVRVKFFADSLARKGHQIILLTRSLNDDDVQKTVAVVREEIANHDWRTPYHLAIVSKKDRILAAFRKGSLPKLFSKMIVGWYFLIHSGVFNDWVKGCRPYLDLLSYEFCPDITWGTFTTTDTWVLAQRISRAADVPWIMDIKDGWSKYIPKLFRRIIANRFRDAAWLTTNCEFNATVAKKWFQHNQTTIYSGISSDLDGQLTDKKVMNENFRIMMIGSIRNTEYFADFLKGLENFSKYNQIEFIYAGADYEKVRYFCDHQNPSFDVTVHSYLPQEEMLNLCASADVNSYIWDPKGFHHKLIELLACNRPVVAFPGEHEESKFIAKKIHGHLFCCGNREEMISCLKWLIHEKNQKDNWVDSEAIKEFTWDYQAEKLLNVFSEILKQR
jgi:glycosyltransferase involved in cell wall biosynthesis